MRILLISDIHANWPALQAIQEPHDLCICVGDIVDYGLEPGPCVDWVRRNTRHAVRGNHDHGAAQNVVVNARRGFRYLTSVTRPLTRNRLSTDDLRYIGRLPVSKTVTVDESRFLLVHATPRDPLDEYGPPEPSFWTRRLNGVDADIIVCGHTHHPFVVEVGKQMVINPGSVGLPRDGDPRGSYAILEGKKVQLKRFEYPVEETIRSVQDSPLPNEAKEMLIFVYRNGGQKQ
jgi:putative phosphoesterase